MQTVTSRQTVEELHCTGWGRSSHIQACDGALVQAGEEACLYMPGKELSCTGWGRSFIVQDGEGAL